MEIAKRLKINNGTVSSIAKRYDLKIKDGGYRNKKYSLSEIQKYLGLSNFNGFNKRFLDYPKYNDFWKLEIPESIIGGDTHCPFIHTEIFNLMAKVASRYGIKTFIHAGDFFDELQFSDFPTSPEDLIDTDTEQLEANAIIEELHNYFNNMYFIQGNHDVRLWKQFIKAGKATKNSWKTIWNLLDKNIIKTSQYRYLELNGYWRITHPKNIIKVGGLPAIRLRAKVDMSLVIAHGHLYGEVPDPSSKYYIINPGCLCDPEKIGYANVWDTSHDLWHPGFMMVVERTKHILFDLNSPYGIYLNGKRKSS